ncbi:metallophosphoesterase family protein [Croceicoccus sp. F390]|uniref:Metallophosphoesterase family protein n=1 Tax=Croceicoccus esteveae TaxID=3075597 RepID=A0ABU2ZDE9_9SPHN|nr:metallophosphoesterase family protein [Croceicoccus sp. F390]MDT0574628.1 metallophosphoesterase family protein [Croceicoccus sp. F390]
MQPSQLCVPDGQRVYAIGDVHGRLDLFRKMINAIEADNHARSPAEVTVILLGDLIDRGPDSAGVIRLARQWSERRDVRLLLGNHEEMFLGALASPDLLRHFLRIGGRETVESYGLPNAAFDLPADEICDMLVELVPPSDIAFLEAMEDQIRIGDYLFVHAGIRPGVTPEQQETGDLRWIREPFLSHRQPHGFCVVHGHTISDEVEQVPSADHPYRIGIDTGAYATGRLTAIGLQGSDRWFMETAVPQG